MSNTTQQHSEIDTYQAGPELDALIAKEVFGIEVVGYSQLGYWVTVGKSEKARWRNLPHYSTDESAAFKIVEHLCRDDREPHELYFKLVYGWWPEDYRQERPLVRAIFDWKKTGGLLSLYQGLADTIALAICRAALRAVRGDLSLPEVIR